MQILKDRGVDVQIIDYMKNPLNEEELREISEKLKLPPGEFIRRKEKIFKELALKEKLDNDNELFRQMAEHPRLIDRPIVVSGNKAILCKPPEKILEIL